MNIATWLPSLLSLEVGKTGTVTATVSPSNATNKSVGKLTPKNNRTDITHIRISLLGTGENLIVTVNEPIE